MNRVANQNRFPSHPLQIRCVALLVSLFSLTWVSGAHSSPQAGSGITVAIPKVSAGWSVDVPPGTTKARYRVYDDDVLSDDLLHGSGFVPAEECINPQTGKLDVIVQLQCVNSEVVGSLGSSGEQEAEVYVILEFQTNSGNRKDVLQTVQMTCPDQSL